jgi:hypothetical protein
VPAPPTALRNSVFLRGIANTRGLRDALRAINRAGGTIEVEWPLQRALEIGDRALAELYPKMTFQPIATHLNHLLEQLGVRDAGQGIALDDPAPLRRSRASICRAEMAG